jgi:protein SCO1/2
VTPAAARSVTVAALALAGLLPRPLPGQAPLPGPLRDVGFDQRPGEPVPLDLAFRDEEGREVKLSGYFGKRPVLLSLVYFECPMLCGMATEGLVRSLRPLSLAPGKDFEVLTVSFDPRETPALAAAKRRSVLEAYGREGAGEGWRFLTGGTESIARLTGAVGFRYVWDEERKQFAHAAGLVVLTPDGRVSRYLFGVDYAPKDIRFAAIEAAGGGVGSIADRAFLLFCYSYDPKLGRYTMTAINLVRGGAVVTVLAIGGFIAAMLRRERKLKPKGA